MTDDEKATAIIDGLSGLRAIYDKFDNTYWIGDEQGGRWYDYVDDADGGHWQKFSVDTTWTSRVVERAWFNEFATNGWAWCAVPDWYDRR